MRFQFKGFTSLLLSLFFLALSVSGVILYLTPRGRMANWTGWTMLGLEKQAWQALHIGVALLFLVAAVVHLVFNWGMFWGYLKKLRFEALAALLIAGFVGVASVQGLAPFGILMTWNNQIKDYWERQPISAPMPHAEELTLEQLAVNMGLSLEQVLQALRQEGIAVGDPSLTVAQVAAQSGQSPSQVHAAIAKHFPQPKGAGPGKGKGPGKGLGRGQGGQGRGFGRAMPE